MNQKIEQGDTDNLYDFITYDDGKTTETETQPATKTVETNAILQEKRQYLHSKNSPLSRNMENLRKV